MIFDMEGTSEILIPILYPCFHKNEANINLGEKQCQTKILFALGKMKSIATA
jgi:hypothetical protein